MSSLCKPADQTPLLQRLMLDGVVLSPTIQYKGKDQPDKPEASRSIYWTDKLNISGPSSNLSNYYYTALAVGATAVCSAGALMQYTEARGAHQSDSLPSDKTIVRSEQSESATTVVTPPVAASQTAASFSSRADQVTLQASSSEREKFQATSLVNQLQTQQAILAHRGTDLAHRQAELAEKSKQLDQRVANLTTYLDIHPKDVEQIANLLNTDTAYQLNRLKLNNLKKAIALEYSKPIVDNPQLEALYSQYTQELAQLRLIAQNVLANYLADVSDGLDEKYYTLLQELIDLAHFRQTHIIQHNMLAQMDAQLSKQRTELAVLISQNSSVRTYSSVRTLGAS